MKKTIAEKWVKALRSKKYRQGQMALKTKSSRGTVRHCCLGVLCELYQKDRRAKKLPPLPTENIPEAEIDKDSQPQCPPRGCVFTFGDDTIELPHRVVKWAGMVSNGGNFHEPFIFEGESVDNLIYLNDCGCKFEQIAQVIEDRVKEL